MDRISSNQLAQQSIAAIRDHQGSLSELQQMVASGKRILKPSDDPVATAQAESTRSDIARMEVESRMIDFARQKMRQSEGALTDGSEILQRSRELLLAANSDSYAPGDRASMASELRGLRDELKSLANRSDGLGTYLFGGAGTRSAPFVETADGMTYVADASQSITGRQYQFAISLDGRALFGSADGPGNSNSIFTALDATIATLEDTTLDAAVRHVGIENGIDQIDVIFERFQVSRASIGHQLNAADRADEEIARGEVGAKERLGELVDVDLAEAISAMSQRQTQLDAAMQTYVKMSGLSLFDYLR